MTARIVLHQADITRALTRISHEILESNRGSTGLVLLGIPTRGVMLATRIGDILDGIDGVEPGSVTVGSLDVTMYRDAFDRRRATAGAQTELLGGVPLWVVPNPSGLNAHETIASLAAAYAEPARAAGLELVPT